MRLLAGIAIAVMGTGALVGCTSSDTASSACDAVCQASISAADSSFLASLSAAAPSSEASNIVDHYDTATCADWAVTDATDRQIAALYYMNEYNDPQPAADTHSMVGIITTTCKSYGAAETPRHIVKVSVAAVYGGN